MRTASRDCTAWRRQPPGAHRALEYWWLTAAREGPFHMKESSRFVYEVRSLHALVRRSPSPSHAQLARFSADIN
jgi:hypothetical protein